MATDNFVYSSDCLRMLHPKQLYTMRAPFFRFLILCLSLICTSAIGILHGQDMERAQSIEAVDVRFDGFKNISEQYVRGNISVQAGEPYEQAKIDESVRSLYRTGLFEFIDVKIEGRATPAVRVEFVIRPKYRVEQIRFEGNEEASDRRLEREVNVRRGMFIDEFNLKSNADKLIEYYLKRGFSDIKITHSVARNEKNGMGVVTFHVDEGTKIKIDDIVFEGNQSFKSKKLRGIMETKRHGMFSWLTGGGKFEKDKFRDSIDKLLSHYRENGFLDVVINEADVRIEYPEDRRMQIVIPVSEGKQYSLGNLSVQGNTVYTDFELLRLVRLVPDSVFSPDKVDEAASDLQKYYGSQGYLDTSVRAERVPNMSTGKIDILFRVDESDKIYVENINIQGNTTTKTIVILRELALAPGEVFDMIRMENSKLRLENTRYFEFVNLTPEETNIPGRRNMRVTVKEGRTGNFSFGAGFSSLEQASFFTEISMGNFDLFNWRSFFQGDGQKFRLRLSVGSRRNEAVLDFQEPWLFEKRLALGVQLFREETDKLISEYDIQRTGFSVSLRQRLFELVEGIYAYRWENIQYSNVSSALTQAYGRNMFGDRDASRFSFTLLRDTRNRMVFTSRGSRVSWMNQVSGTVFGGDVDAWNSELRLAQFIPTFSTLNQSLAILGRVGTVMPLEDARYVYASDRYYLGGPEDLRGFEYREVGPKTVNGDVSTGGNTYGFLSLEYQFQLSEQFQFVTFYDWGFLNEEDFDFNPAKYNDNFGFGIRMLVMGAPMRLDYGIPITSDGVNDKGGQFHFSFGTRF